MIKMMMEIFFYIIAKGKVSSSESEDNNKEPNYINEWECFGELSLLALKKRDTIVKCEEDVELYVIDGESFRDLQKRNNEMLLKERFNFLNTISIFECLDKISKYNVAQKLTKREFPQRHKIISRGDTGDKLYIIKEGLVSCRIDIQEIRKLGAGEYFGQNAILIDVKRGADIIALQKTVCYELSRDDLKDALSNDYIDVILFCFFKNCIENNEYLKNTLIESLFHEVFQCFSIEKYAKKEQVYNPKSTEGLKANNKKLICVIEGSLFKDKALIAEKGKIIGEEMLKDFNKSITEDIIAFPDCITMEASITDIAKIMKDRKSVV